MKHWIKTQNGDYVNLNEVAMVEKYFGGDKYAVVAIFQASYGVDNNAISKQLFQFETEDEAQKYMDDLFNDA